jgi:hypothetical protein
MEIGLIGLVGLHVRQHVVQLQYIVCYLIKNKNQVYKFFIGTRNCTGASNGGVCLGSALDTQLCDTNVSCSGELDSHSLFYIFFFVIF